MNMRVDPVCGMTVDPATAAGKFDYEGETYYFCSPNCLRKFSADPQAYLAQDFASLLETVALQAGHKLVSEQMDVKTGLETG